MPCALSLALAAGAVAAWSRALPFRLLALHWALGSLAFARPALRLRVADDWRPWVEAVTDGAMIGALIVCAGLAVMAIVLRDARAVRIAVFAAVGTWAAVLVALSLSPGLAVDGAAYLTILGAAALAWRAAHLERTSA